jgi:hypothetical protein
MDGNMKKLTALSLALFSLSLTPAAFGAQDGYELLTNLKECDRNAQYRCGSAEGYIWGIYHTLQDIKLLCVPNGTRNGQAIAVVKKFLEENPARQNLTASALTGEALIVAWKCPALK